MAASLEFAPITLFLIHPNFVVLPKSGNLHMCGNVLLHTDFLKRNKSCHRCASVITHQLVTGQCASPIPAWLILGGCDIILALT
jgi:hypothetical protein